AALGQGPGQPGTDEPGRTGHHHARRLSHVVNLPARPDSRHRVARPGAVTVRCNRDLRTGAAETNSRVRVRARPGRPGRDNRGMVTGEIRWGIVGPGGIARKVIKDFTHVPHARAVAVASRSQQRADAFAAEHGLPLAYGDYRELIMS